MRRFVGMLVVAAGLAGTTACAPAARFMLFVDAPSFVLDADEADGGVALVGRGLLPEDFEDDLCTAEEEEDGCDEDYFVGIAFYRADDGPYGTYVELGRAEVDEWFDPEPAGDDTVWRAGVLREAEGDDVRVDKVSIAAVLGSR